MSDRPEKIFYTADVVCVRGGTEVLFIERGWEPFKGMLALPGGHVDAGETAAEAAVRELEEETGVVVPRYIVPMSLGVYDAPDRDPRGRYVTAAYLIRVPMGTEAVAGDDAASVRWIPFRDIPELAYDHNKIVDDARLYRLYL